MNKRVIPKKPKKEPIRCLRCQKFGHERCDCKAEIPRCGKCANSHETAACTTDRFSSSCANCNGHHPSYDRECPKFWEKCQQLNGKCQQLNGKGQQLNGKCPENKLAFYPTEDEWTWATVE